MTNHSLISIKSNKECAFADTRMPLDRQLGNSSGAFRGEGQVILDATYPYSTPKSHEFDLTNMLSKGACAGGSSRHQARTSDGRK